MRRSFIGVLAALVVAAHTGAVFAHDRTFGTTITLTKAEVDTTTHTALYAGRVTSGKDACLKRTVVVSFQGANGKVQVARGQSTASGSYSLSGMPPPQGTPVKATAKKKVLRNTADHLHVCKAATSSSLVPGPPSGGGDGGDGGGGDGGDGTGDIDLTALPLGDDKYVDSAAEAARGYIFSCQTTFNGGGAFTQGPWFNGDGTWDYTVKEDVTVNGAVDWPHELTVTKSGSTRVFSGNNLPDHPTGTYPISSSDDAYQYDRNPHAIEEQDVAFELPATPTYDSTPECAGGSVGYMLSGAYLFNGFDAGGRDAVAWEIQDDCDGHPQSSGAYHYHSISRCAEGTTSDGGHSDLLGYAFDGFGIYGKFGSDGDLITNADLDVCHGHTHSVAWDGTTASMFHYHLTYEFPYSVGCFRGDGIRVETGEGGGGGGPPPPPGGGI